MSIKSDMPLVEEIKDYFIQIQQIDPQDLIREKELGPTSFAPYFNDFFRVISFFKRLSYLDINSLPSYQLSTIRERVLPFLDTINEIKNFKVDINNGVPQRNTLADTLINSYQTSYDQLSPIISYCEKEGTDYQALQLQVNQTVESINLKYKEIIETAEIKIAELNKILDAAKKAAHEVGITQHTVNFEEASKKYQTLSKYWMCSIISTGIIIILLSLYIFNLPIEIEANDPYASYRFIQAAVARFTALFTLILLLFWEVRNYNAAQHNYTINQNKQNALSTFETFVSAARDEETKNAVLMQTTKAIFSNLPSGYLKNESGDDGSSQIIEIARGIGSKISN